MKRRLWHKEGRLKGLLLAIVLLACNVLSAQALPIDTTKVPQDTIRIGKSSIKGFFPTADSSANQTDTDKAVVDGQDSTASDSNKTGPFRRSTKTKVTVSRLPNGLKTFYDPKVALRRSAILPGWGQLYNDRWWKVPFIYGGFAVFTAFIIQNNQKYIEYNNGVMCKADTCSNDTFPEYTVDILISKREFHRKYRDMNFIFLGLWYTLNLVDAYVDAHLRSFNVSPDLSMDVNPHFGVNPRAGFSPYLGASVTLKLRR